MNCEIVQISPVKKNKRGQIVSYAQKVIIVNLYKTLLSKDPFCSHRRLFREISSETGIGFQTIYKIVREYTEKGHVTPTIRRRRLWAKQPDEFEATAIRRIVHQFFSRNEQPTIRKILSVINADETLPNYCHTKFYQILLRLDFRYVKRSRKSILLEREDLISWRQSYLQQIHQHRMEGRKIYYLDETWLNEGHTTAKCWCDTTVNSVKNAFLRGLTTGLKNPSGKGKRLIILHIGNEDGFVNGGALVFESNKSSDYHEEMTGNVFNEWFSQVLDILEPGSVIVLDNASYHSVKVEKIPTTASNKAAIKAWLDSKGIPYEEDSLKKDLLVEVQRVRSEYDRYVVDTMAESRGFTVLRLPPYHCELNPIELIWAYIKSYAARWNVSYKLSELKGLLEEAMSRVTAEIWKNCVDHVKNKVEPKMRETDGIILTHPPVKPVIITLDNDSDFEDDSAGDDFYGLFPEALLEH